MRWASWALGIVGVVQHALIVWYSDASYVSVDMSYLVMFLCVIGALLLCLVSCWGCGDWGGCGCCGDGCACGDCEGCSPAPNGHGPGHAHSHEGEAGHEGHSHGPGEHRH